MHCLRSYFVYCVQFKETASPERSSISFKSIWFGDEASPNEGFSGAPILWFGWIIFTGKMMKRKMATGEKADGLDEKKSN